MSWKPDIFIYHSPCDDGFGAAWAVWKRWGDSVELVPASYGKPPPDVSGKHVLIGDFSFKRLVLDEMANAAKSIVILDHHKTAQDDLAPFAVEMCGSARLSCGDIPGMLRDLAELNRPPVVASFDMAKSGACLIWEFCHLGKPLPQLIRFIEDRDLWLFENANTRGFSLWLRSHPYNLQTWDRIARQLEDPENFDAIMLQAAAIEAFYDQKVGEVAAVARIARIDGHLVPVVNCIWALASDVAHQLLALYPDAPFAATYFDRSDGARSFSLRSEDARMDVSAVARRYGGGGHRNAAGFEVPQL